MAADIRSCILSFAASLVVSRRPLIHRRRILVEKVLRPLTGSHALSLRCSILQMVVIGFEFGGVHPSLVGSYLESSTHR